MLPWPSVQTLLWNRMLRVVFAVKMVTVGNGDLAAGRVDFKSAGSASIFRVFMISIRTVVPKRALFGSVV